MIRRIKRRTKKRVRFSQYAPARRGTRIELPHPIAVKRTCFTATRYVTKRL